MMRLLAATSVFALMLTGAAVAQTAGSATSGMGMPGSQNSSDAQMSGSTSGQAAISATTVKQAQTELKQQGLYDGDVDGKIGPKTRSAVSQYQKKEGLKQTASLDQATLSHLMGHDSSGSSSTSGSSPSNPGSNAAPGGGSDSSGSMGGGSMGGGSQSH